MPTKIVSWNIARRRKPWRQLLQMDADVALLQEAGRIPEDVSESIEVGGDELRDSDSYDRFPMIARLSDRVSVEWFNPVDPTGELGSGDFTVSDIGTIAAARIVPDDSPPFMVFSMYARWERPHPSTASKWFAGYSDGSAHRIVSDLSTFIGSEDPSTHRILAAGDLNQIYGATDDNRNALPARDRSVMDRLEALGLEFLGPQHPAGRLADPTPEGLPPDTRNVPIWHSTADSPATARIQLDYVFASRGFHGDVSVRAMNSVEEWGASDHCRLLIEVAGT